MAKASQEETKGRLEGLREAIRVAEAGNEKALQAVARMKEKTEKDVKVGGRRVRLVRWLASLLFIF